MLLKCHKKTEKNLLTVAFVAQKHLISYLPTSVNFEWLSKICYPWKNS